MAALVARISDLATRIAAEFRANLPRLLPTGGATGQVLAKGSASNYAVVWADPPSGGGGGDSMTLIADVTLSGLNVDVLNIPQTYKALKIVVLEARHSNGSNGDTNLRLRGGGSDWVDAGALIGASGAINNTKEISCIIDIPRYTFAYFVYTMFGIIHQTNPVQNASYSQANGNVYVRAMNLFSGGVKHVRFNSGYGFTGGKAVIYGIS